MDIRSSLVLNLIEIIENERTEDKDTFDWLERIAIIEYMELKFVYKSFQIYQDDTSFTLPSAHIIKQYCLIR